MSKENLKNCPFCDEEDFDLIGLKHHLHSGHCEEFNTTMTPQEATEAWNRRITCKRIK